MFAQRIEERNARIKIKHLIFAIDFEMNIDRRGILCGRRICRR